ncbi:MAG: C39 family peptidase [Patescibacteria group bacterium]
MKNIAIKFVMFLLLFTFVFTPFSVKSASVSDLQKTKNALQEQLKQISNQKVQNEKDQQMLQDQITRVTDQISQTEKVLTQTSSQIGDTESAIETLLEQIKTQQGILAETKDRLGRVVSSWYMEGNDGLLTALLSSGNVSELVEKQEYYDSLKQQIESEIDQIVTLQANLAAKKSEQENQLQALNSLKEDQASQQQNLEKSKQYKAYVLDNKKDALDDLKTQESETQKRISQIDSQIRALTATSRWGDQIVSDNGGLSVPFYAQTGNYTKLGNSPYTVNQYGCLITSIAMVASYYGNNVTPTSIASNTAIFDREGYLLVTTPPGVGVNVLPSQGINWDTVDAELAAKRPVIISIFLPTVGAVNRDGSSHFIVIKGKTGNKYLMNDPIGIGRGYNMSQVRSMKLIRSY